MVRDILDDVGMIEGGVSFLFFDEEIAGVVIFGKGLDDERFIGCRWGSEKNAKLAGGEEFLDAKFWLLK